jgi:hypothetical protein
MDELEKVKLVAAAWREQAHMMLDQIVTMGAQAQIAAEENEPQDDDSES